MSSYFTDARLKAMAERLPDRLPSSEKQERDIILSRTYTESRAVFSRCEALSDTSCAIIEDPGHDPNLLHWAIIGAKGDRNCRTVSCAGVKPDVGGRPLNGPVFEGVPELHHGLSFEIAGWAATGFELSQLQPGKYQLELIMDYSVYAPPIQGIDHAAWLFFMVHWTQYIVGNKYYGNQVIPWDSTRLVAYWDFDTSQITDAISVVARAGTSRFFQFLQMKFNLRKI